MMRSRGLATTLGGSNVSLFGPPTVTVCHVPFSAAGVGPGEPGYEVYVVVQILEPRVTA